MRASIAKPVVLCVGVVLGIVLVALVYLNFADLGRHRSAVESVLTRFLGRELRIAGEFEVDFGFDTTIRAGGITLANPDWSSEPEMISVDRLELEVNLWSLLSRPIRVHRLATSGSKVQLEATDGGRRNWIFRDAATDRRTSAGPPRLALGTVDIQSTLLEYRGPALDRPLHIWLGSVHIESDPSGMLDVDLSGTVNESELTLAGRIGTLAGLLEAGALSLDLEGRLGSVDLAARGRVGRLATLADADLEVQIEGPAMSEVTDLLGLPDLGDGPFRVSARARPSVEGSYLELDTTLGEVTVRASGSCDALLAPDLLDLEVSAAGPNLAAVAELAGVTGGATRPFSLSGRLRWQGFPVTLDNVELTVGDNVVSLHGTLGAPPALLGTDFRITAAGPDVSALAALGGLALPVQAFRVKGHLVRLERAIRIEDLEATVGPNVLRAGGSVGDPPDYAATDLQVSAHGPDLSVFSGLSGVSLPALPFELAGRFTPDGDSIGLDDVSARVGEHTARIEGTVKTEAGFVGSALRLDVAGPDLVWLEPITGFENLPSTPFRVIGGVRVESGSVRLDGLEGRVGEVTATVDGRIGLPPDFVGTDVSFVAEGPDVSIPASLVGISGMPADPFRIEGGLTRTDDGIALEGVQSEIGAARANVSGVVAARAGLVGTILQFDVSGPDISTIAPTVGQRNLRPGPFSARGSIEIDDVGFRLRNVIATLGEARAEITGTVGIGEGWLGTDADFHIAGPALAGVGSFLSATGIAELPALPDEPFSLTGGIAVDETGYGFRKIQLSLADATASIDGIVGHPPAFVGTDLTISGDGPNASLFASVAGVSIPVAPFRIGGRVQRLEDGLRFDAMRVRLGEYRVRADGRLGEPPQLVGTDLEVEASGPSLLLVSQLARVTHLPDQPFSLAGRFEGNPMRFKTDDFSATLGSSDIRGNFRIDLADRPRLNANLESRLIDLREIVRPDSVDQLSPSSAEDDTGGAKGPLISDEPVDLGILDRFDGTLRWSVGAPGLPTSTFRDVLVVATLENGHLNVSHVTAAGAHGGALDGTLTVSPDGPGRALTARLSIADSRLDMSTVEDQPDEWPTVDVDLDLTASGISARDLAASSNGRITLVMGEGVMDNRAVELLAADIVVKLLEILNPFRKEAPTTMLRCAVIVVDVTDGVAIFDPIAIQTDKVTILGDGKIDLSTEKIDFDWVTKPRKGLGLSATMITNPYIKLGGTLSGPSITMKPLEAAASTGIAVATGGLSLLGRGLFDRITADQDVCAQAIKQSAKKLAKQQAAEGQQ